MLVEFREVWEMLKDILSYSKCDRRQYFIVIIIVRGSWSLVSKRVEVLKEIKNESGLGTQSISLVGEIGNLEVTIV